MGLELESRSESGLVLGFQMGLAPVPRRGLP